MGLRKGHTIELTVEDMAYGGHGVGRVDGLVVFVRGTVPGDRILARVTRKKKDYAEAGLMQILQASRDRIPAPCPYSGVCGGCQWQHVAYKRQLDFKREHVLGAVMRIGGLRDVHVHATMSSHHQLAYRNKMEFSFSDRRWLMPGEIEDAESDRGSALGLHVPGTFHKVIDINACLLQHDTGNRILQEVKTLTRKSGIPVYGLKSHEGFWRFLTLRHSRAFDEWMVNIVTSAENRDAIETVAKALTGSFSSIKTIVNNISAGKACIALGEREIPVTGPGVIEDRIGPYNFRISANSFFQTNTSGTEILYNKVIDFAELNGKETVLDLYSGTGTIPIFLSERAASVVGMEIVQSAVLDAEMNCRANAVHNCRFILGDIRENLRELDWKPDVLIIDPPRAGMHKDVLSRVMEMGTERIVYVSCNPTTLARDLAHMAEGYKIVEIQPVDMFPQTYHVESVTRLIRKK
ncbi:MAG: 23S rRNA (uracil(1939)-C(5))-methyltransferase RlmD [Desulfatiglandales bacterium]